MVQVSSLYGYRVVQTEEMLLLLTLSVRKCDHVQWFGVIPTVLCPVAGTHQFFDFQTHNAYIINFKSISRI